MSTYLDGIIGWTNTGRRVDTWWMEDPAVDSEQADFLAYQLDLDSSHLPCKAGKKPVRMVVALPRSEQWSAIVPHVESGILATSDGGFNAAASVAFQLCVRFPDVEIASPVNRLGFQRLPEDFMRGLQIAFPMMIPVVGSWLIRNYTLTDDEKKASLLESTKKTSEKSESVTPVATDSSESKDAPTLEQPPAPKATSTE